MEDILERFHEQTESVRAVLDRLAGSDGGEEAVDLLRTLVADVANELNNSIGSVMLAAELALSNLASPQTVTESLHTIKVETLRCRNIVKAVKDTLRQS